jgi:hypothetical protein
MAEKLLGNDDATQIGVYLKGNSDPDRFLRASLSPEYSIEIMNNKG